MAISKAARIWLIVLAIPVVLIIAVLVAAKLYFTSDRLKALIVPRIEESTRRTVLVKDISLNVFPSIAVSIDGLRISNPQDIHFDRSDFLSLDNLRLRVRILPLLSNKLEISYVILDRPTIYLEVTKDGFKNYSSKQPGAPPDTSASRVRIEKSGTGELLLSNLEINDGMIEMVDKKFDSRMKIGGFHQTASVESKPGERTIQIRGESTIDRFSYGTLTSWYLSDQPITAKEKLTYDIDKDALLFDELNAKLKEIPLTVSGTISQMTRDTLMMDLAVTSPNVQMAQLLSLVPPEMLKKAEGLNASGDVKFSAVIRGPSSETMNPGTRALFTVGNGRIQYASPPKAITNINVDGVFDKPPAPVEAMGIGNLAINKLTATLGTNEISGKLTVAGFSDPTIMASFSGSMNLGEVKDFYPLEAGTELSGMMKADVSLNGKAKVPQTIKANGSVTFQNVTIKNPSSPSPLRNLNGTITFNNQLVESKQLAMNIGESDLNLSFALRNYLGMVMKEAEKSAGTPSATVTLTSHQLRTADLISETKSEKEKAETKKPKTASGGLLPGINVDANVNIDKLITEKFMFTNARGVLGISNGIINLKNFSVNAFDGSIQTKGTLDLRDTTKRPFDLDLTINRVESHALLPKFTSFGNYVYGKFSTTTKIQGDLNDTLGLVEKTLAGNGTVDIADGKLLGFPLMQKLADFTNVSELREVNFKDWTNSFSISNGRLNIKDLKVNAGATSFLMDGSQGLDGSLDYVLTVKLPAALSDRIMLPGVGAELLQFFKDKEGRLNLAFNVTGTASDPVLHLNTQAQQDLAKQAIEQKKQQLIEEGKKKAEEELKKKAQEGLKKLFKKP